MTKQQRKIEFLLGIVLSAMIAALALIGYGSGKYPAESIIVFLLMFLPITLAPTICSSRPLARPVLPRPVTRKLATNSTGNLPNQQRRGT